MHMPHVGKKVSPWHEIPLYAGDGQLHFICEIPKETSAKMEVATVGGATDPAATQAHHIATKTFTYM